MATSAKGGKSAAKGRNQRSNADLYRIPVDMVPVAESSEDVAMSALGWVAAVVLVALMLPLLAFMLLETLDQRQEVKQQTEKVEKLRREIERKNRDKTPDSITDNPVFDRVRRPF